MSRGVNRRVAASGRERTGVATFDVHLESVNRRHLIRLFGEIDVLAQPALQDAIDRAIKVGGQLIVDLSGTTFMDSTGLNVLVQAHHRMGRLQEAIVLRSPSPVVDHLLRVTGIGELITVERAESAKGRVRQRSTPADPPVKRSA